MSAVIQKVAQKVAVDYCRLTIVENPDGFLTQDIVCRLLDQQYGIEVVTGTNLQLRIHYELYYPIKTNKKFVYVCSSLMTILADMKQSAYLCDFSVSDVFPLFADKTLLRKQPYEVLDALYENYGSKRLSMLDCSRLIRDISKELEADKRHSVEYLTEQLKDLEIDWHRRPAQTISAVSCLLAKAIKNGEHDAVDGWVNDINEQFQQWIDVEYFATLQSNPLLKAKSVNKILPHLASKYQKEEKVALLVVDGFSYWQYCIMKDCLTSADFEVEDGCTLAWMPSITMLSRQAIFRGANPVQDYKQSPENEKRLWFAFWQQYGFGSYELQYLYDTDEFAINEGVKRLAIVTAEMDEKMHSSSDYKDLCSLTENWCSRILTKIEAVVNAGYTLYLTTDHGSVLSHGWRTLSTVEKVFLYKDGSRGMRHLIYNNQDEQERFFTENTDLRLIKHDNWMAMRDNRCFAHENKEMITHGGCHFLEMVIPLVKIVK